MNQMPTNTRAVFDVIRSGNALDTSILGNVADVRSQMEAAIAGLATTDSDSSGESGSSGLGNDALTEAKEKLESLTSAEGMFSSLQDHLQNQFTNLPRNLNLYVSNFGLNQGLGTIPQFPSIPPVFGTGGIGAEAAPQSIGDICANINDFFGSLIGKAAEFMQEIGSLLVELTQRITELLANVTQAVIDAINIVVNQIMVVANRVTQMIADEIAKNQEALTDALAYANTVSFQNIFSHPCAKTVLGAVGSGALIAALTMR